MLKHIESKFTAGSTMRSALAAAKRLNKSGIAVSIDILLPAPKSNEEARSNADAYVKLLGALRSARIDADVSLKLTTLGLALGDALCEKNLLAVAEAAAAHGIAVTIDMEEHKYRADTMRIFESARRHCAMRLTLQAYLHSSYHDAKMLVAKDAMLRLVKGAYAEPSSAAFQSSGEIDKNFIEIAKLLLASDQRHAFATHDAKMIDFIRYAAGVKKIAKRSFEFQMLYGVRDALARQLAAEGYAVRIYVPYGKEWLPYVMRRITEAFR